MKTRRSKTMTDPIQLQQKMIYFQSELTKYQRIVKSYENSYHISQFQKLKEENSQLNEEIEKLRKEVKKSKETSENEHTPTINADYLQLKQEKEEVEDELLRLKEGIEDDKKRTENKLSQLTSEITVLKNENEVLNEKNKSLQNTLNALKSKTQGSTEDESTNLSDVELKVIDELDAHFKHLLSKAFDNDKLADPKSILIQELENEIHKLTKELEDMESSNNSST